MMLNRYFLPPFPNVLGMVLCLLLCASPAFSAKEDQKKAETADVKLFLDETAWLTYYQYILTPEPHHRLIRKWRITDPASWLFYRDLIGHLPEYYRASFSELPVGRSDVFLLNLMTMEGLPLAEMNFYKGFVILKEYHYYYEFFIDTSGFEKFLYQQRRDLAAFDKSRYDIAPEGSEISGIIGTYKIFKTLDDPAWHIAKPEEIALYKSFLIGLQKIRPTEALLGGHFNHFDSYTLYSNSFVTDFPEEVAVYDGFIRVKRKTESMKLLKDDIGIFDFFREEDMLLRQLERIGKPEEKGVYGPFRELYGPFKPGSAPFMPNLNLRGKTAAYNVETDEEYPDNGETLEDVIRQLDEQKDLVNPSGSSEIPTDFEDFKTEKPALPY